jgi:glutamate-1-semialdehyde 2,1-aminomutase
MKSTIKGNHPMEKTHATSRALFERAQRVIPGGVNSPVRAFKSVGGSPPFIDRGSGAYIFDADANRYIDYVLSWGPLILGHAHPEVAAAAAEAVSAGSSFGAPTEREVRLAEAIISFFPTSRMARLVSSGTEAAMTAVRLARGVTGRDKIVKFTGCYHGHSDSLLSEAGSGIATLGIPATPGVTAATAADTLTTPFNDAAALETVFDRWGGAIAAVIVEPLPGNMGVVPPVEGFLPGLVAAARSHGALVIFDEVMSGFRAALGGAQTLWRLDPDITLLGKVVGGGFPLAAVIGKEDIMRHLAPSGPVYQAGTLSGNPVAVAAGIATLTVLTRPGVFDGIVKRTDTLRRGILDAASSAGVGLWGAAIGTMGSFFFCDGPVRNFAEAKAARSDLFVRWFHEMLDRGIYLAPSPYEAFFLSAAHSDRDIDDTVSAAREAFARL